MYRCLCGGARRVPDTAAVSRRQQRASCYHQTTMSSRSDASTSTDDIKGRPLCMFYFSHPFAVLSPEPPTVTTAPPNITRAFINMEPVSPFHFWTSSTDDSYNTVTTSTSKETSASNLKYDLGKTTVHKNPVQVVSVARTRKCTIDFGSGRDTLSSSLFSSDIWFSSGSSARSYEYTRRIIPYHRILPPLQLPPPKDSTWESSDDVWPSRCSREKFSLPPIELPVSKTYVDEKEKQLCDISSVDSGSVRVRWRRRLGVKKRKKRLHLSGIRRMVTCLMRRVVRGVGGRSPALQNALATIRDAWAEPASLLERCHRAVTRMSGVRRKETRASEKPKMLTRTQLAELPPRPGASPGLLRRRYSVPETIMRKYRLAQQRSDSDDSGPTTSPSPASASPPRGSCNSLCESPHRFMRRDRELMRKSALLRRMWGRPGNPCQTCCCCSGDLCDSQPYCGRETRSLDGSRSELRHLSSSFTSSRQSHGINTAGWATPKRQRLESPRDFRGSDEMLRTAMRNSYDRAEESRYEVSIKPELSDSTCQSYNREVSSYIETTSDPLTDSDIPKYENRSGNVSEYPQTLITNAAIMDIDSFSGNTETLDSCSKSDPHADEHSLGDTSESFSISMVTTKDRNEPIGQKVSKISTSGHIDGRISERSVSVENDETNILPYDTPLSLDTPSYEILEIVVSESQNTNLPAIKSNTSDVTTVHTLKTPDNSAVFNKKMQNINIDEYVSNILVESLNSLTDQIECMNASMGSDRKVSIVEKEIKVKLQNTGVNTIVHLSPMSNNQIIFGNEELYNNDENKDNCNNPQDARDSITIREEMHSLESNNNVLLSGSSLHDNVAGFDKALQNDNVNRAVLQQIQKLFQDELNYDNDDRKYLDNTMPSISHIEIANVSTVYIDDNSESITVDASDDVHRELQSSELISSIGAGNYYPDSNDNAVVPRFSALPHTDSMEVNTSSSEDPDNIGSDCTSLVDSLDDPNSPRSVFLRKAYNTSKRNELVRSAIDVLDLLPESEYKNHHFQTKDKGEAFFIRIKDNDFDCEKKDIVVADHMPEKIKQRLYRRHRKREMRMECARRSKVKQMKREIEKQRLSDACKTKKEIEKDCMAIINALIDDVIAKIAQDEHKCMRIKQKTNRMVTSKSDENISKRNWKRDFEYFNNKNSVKNKSNPVNSSGIERGYKKSDKHQIHGKLSLLAHPQISPDNYGPRRIYQKSEIHDGNKCIEILEILEYVNSSQSQSSPDITNSDDSPSNASKLKKSRIPIPVYEKYQKTSNYMQKSCKTGACKRPTGLPRDKSKSDQLITNMLLEVLADDSGNEQNDEHDIRRPPETPARRASVPHYEPRSRSNSLRFKRVFDIIPEERSSLSVDSSNEEINYNRRSSAPNLVDGLREIRDNNLQIAQREHKAIEAPKIVNREPVKAKETRSAGTSPLSSEPERILKKKSQLVMTSPNRKSAATSPIPLTTSSTSNGTSTGTTANGSLTTTTTTESPRSEPPAPASGKRGLASRGRAWLGFTRPDYKLHEEGSKEKHVEEKLRDHRSTTTQCDREDPHRTVRTIQTETVDPIIVGGDRFRDNRDKSKTRRGDEKVSDTKKNRTGRTKSESRERANFKGTDDGRGADVTFRKTDKRKIRTISMERSEEETVRTKSVKLPEFKQHQQGGGAASSSSSSESGGSLLCSLAPKWLSAHSRHKRAARRRDSAPAEPQDAGDEDDPGGWSVTVAGTCRAALPADVEMRLRFPPEREQTLSQRISSVSDSQQEWSCRSRRCPECSCACCGGPPRNERRPPLPPALPPQSSPQSHIAQDSGRLTLTMKKEALGSSVLATKTAKKSTDPLPDLETYRASRSKMKSSVKTRRGYSLHCWLPDEEPAMIRSNNGLSVLGSAIIPELKPRVPTMSERDLTRVYTPRHYLRS